ncbi:transcription antitermination factor NusB [Geomonas sp. Red69]|uniref:Transcription antitermination protein NusB n=1 Tax=Geomonas diazotrophica TaxID=2843197 RepID=A0ABX8JT82_9BACT|nr:MULTISPECIES: transcription antitermination factor NusB [Geomonas]MBU5636576.1 transcription antitermination factor NusB [Geomonas diazotrophica]QWV98625.1 transcription antitermination factor NusB [Geomonas nitrogeniifigens]QXE87801.1 transcription antitermination factor NusB [Geomonas nitrogeniifigens]
MTTRREGRELALQALYSKDLVTQDPNITLKRIVESFGEGEDPTLSANSKAYAFASELVAGVASHLQEIDGRIAEKSKHWSMARMARVDLNILRLAVFELLFRPDIPKNVTMNEAIEVAKKFGADDSASFVNGILDEIASTVTDKE